MAKAVISGEKEKIAMRAAREPCHFCGCPHDRGELCMIEVRQNHLATVAKEQTVRVGC